MTEPMSKERLRFLADYYNVDRMPTTTAAELCAEIWRLRAEVEKRDAAWEVLRAVIAKEDVVL